MGNSFRGFCAGIVQIKETDSWWERVVENARAFVALRGTCALAHGGAGAFYLLKQGLTQGTRQSNLDHYAARRGNCGACFC